MHYTLSVHLSVSPSVRPFVLCLCHLLNVPTPLCADVPYNWQWPGWHLSGWLAATCMLCYSVYFVREGHRHPADVLV